ncbi:MAG TPA: SRPBCC domain-containing protein [Acidimicrobiia bacterium]|jgi:uncharacterized protein YndB with AHSA1/START domain
MEHVEREVELPQEPSTVWEAVADPALLGLWLGGELELDGGVHRGTRGTFDTPTERRLVYVRDVDEGERLVFNWRPVLSPLEMTTVTISVVPSPAGGTIVRITERRPTRAMALA